MHIPHPHNFWGTRNQPENPADCRVAPEPSPTEGCCVKDNYLGAPKLSPELDSVAVLAVALDESDQLSDLTEHTKDTTNFATSSSSSSSSVWGKKTNEPNKNKNSKKLILDPARPHLLAACS